MRNRPSTASPTASCRRRPFPESGRRVPEAPTLEIREFIEFPYRLIYRMHADAIEILAIVHGRQDLPTHLPR
jgi:toxin ParE1/3/4